MKKNPIYELSLRTRLESKPPVLVMKQSLDTIELYKGLLAEHFYVLARLQEMNNDHKEAKASFARAVGIKRF
ncbi:MAG: hypothetical protein KAI70_00785 [Candidatus Omnitrophica bacterium]|nr:hypothetical protein [Candidatus Omnitrophota bacterium]